MTEQTALERLDDVWDTALDRDAKLVGWHMDYTTYRELQATARERFQCVGFNFDGGGLLKLRGLIMTFHATEGPRGVETYSALSSEIAKREPFMLALEMKSRMDRVFYIDHVDSCAEWKREGRDAE